MLKTIFRGLVLILVSLPFALPVNAQSSHNEFAFAYIEVISNTTLALVRLNPADLDHPYSPILLSVPEGLSLTVATSSPSGEWVFLEFSSNLTSVIQAYNALTGELHTIANDTFAVAKGVSDFQAWSPDSEYFAMYVDYRNGGSAMLVYSLLNKTLINLTSMRDSAEQLAWSQDSAYILTSHSYCVSTSGCELFFDKYAIPSGIGETYAVDTGLCNIQWSPDGLYAAFVNACYPTFGVTSARELHILDVQQENYERITNNTIGLRSQYPNHQIDGEYDTYWYNNDTLLVGSTFTNGLGTRGTETFLYNVVTQQKNLITPDAIFNWTPNPVYNKLAFQRVTGFTSPDGYIFNPINSVIQVATFNGTTLQTVASGPSGCNLSWSPDGQYLVYEKLEKPLCEYSQRVSIVFVSQATGTLQEYSAPSTLNRTIGIGWLKIPPGTTSRQRQPSTATRREALSAAECERACWMGIEPGVTTVDQFKDILSNQGITWNLIPNYGTPTPDPVSGVYFWIFSPSIPFAHQNGEQYGDMAYENYVVDKLNLPLGVPISLVLEAYGNPEQVLVQEEKYFMLTYPDEGLVFQVSLPFSSEITSSVWLVTNESLHWLFLDRADVLPLEACVEPATICNIPTATPMPASTTLREVLSAPGCLTACWMGIEPEVTTRDDALKILAAHGIVIHAIGSSDDVNFDIGSSFPLLGGRFRFGTIRFLWDQVRQIELPTNVTFSQLAEAYGIPERVIYRDDNVFQIVYATNRIVFQTSELNPDQINILYITNDHWLNAEYVAQPPYSSLVTDCTKTAPLAIQLCALMAGTPMPATLREVLSAPGCVRACWYGNEPQVTDESTLFASLQAKGITVTYVGDSYGELMYSLTAPSLTQLPFIAPDPTTLKFGFITVSNGKMGLARLDVNIPLDQILDEWGIPSKIERSADTMVSFAYYDKGVSFRTTPDGTTAYEIVISTPGVIKNSYIVPTEYGGMPAIETCDGLSAAVCQLIPATPMP